MKKILYTFLLISVFVLGACEDNNESGLIQSDLDTKTPTENSNDTDKTLIDSTSDNEYKKDGDIVNYFLTFGQETDCTELWGSGESSTCYSITFSEEGYDYTVRYYYLPDAYYKTFDIVSKSNDMTLTIQLDYMVRIDTSIKYSNNGQFIDGFLTFTGTQENPSFTLNHSYNPIIQGTDAENSMQTILDKMIVAVNAYYQENIDASIVTVSEEQ